MICSLLAVFFLTAQTCSFGAVGTGLAADCIGDGDVVCDEDTSKAYVCSVSDFGTGYYVTRDSSYDTDCGGTSSGSGTSTCSGDYTTLEDQTDVLDLKIEKNVDNLASLTALYDRGSATTKDTVFAVRKLTILEADFGAQETILSDLAADLATFEATYTDCSTEVAAMSSALDDSKTKLADAEIALTDLLAVIDADLLVRWVPVDTDNLYSASVVGSASGATVPLSDLFFTIANGGYATLKTLGKIDTAGTFSSLGAASSYSYALMVGGSKPLAPFPSSTWAGFDGEVVDLQYYDSSGTLQSLTVYLPVEDLSSLTNDRMFYFVAADGSTFYIDSAGIPASFTSLSPGMIMDKLARAAE